MHAAQGLTTRTEAEPAGAVVVAGDEHHLGAGRPDPVEAEVEQCDRVLGRLRPVVDVTGDEHEVDPVVGDSLRQPRQEGPLILVERLALEPPAEVPVARVDDPHVLAPYTSTDCQTGVSPTATIGASPAGPLSVRCPAGDLADGPGQATSTDFIRRPGLHDPATSSRVAGSLSLGLVVATSAGVLILRSTRRRGGGAGRSDAAVEGVDQRPVPGALPPGDHVVHDVPERHPVAGVGEPDRSAGPEVTETARIGPEPTPGRGGCEAESEGHLLPEDGAPSRRLGDVASDSSPGDRSSPGSSRAA